MAFEIAQKIIIFNKARLYAPALRASAGRLTLCATRINSAGRPSWQRYGAGP